MPSNHRRDAMDGDASGVAVNHRCDWYARLRWVTLNISHREVKHLSPFSLSFISIFGRAVTYYSFKQFFYLQKHPPDETTIVTNASKLFEKWGKEKNVWLTGGIITAVILVVILLIVLVLRKRIVIAIALVKEGSKYVFGMHSSRCISAHLLSAFISISGQLVRSRRLCFSRFSRGSFKSLSSLLRSSLDCTWRQWANRWIKLFACKRIQAVDAKGLPSITRMGWIASPTFSISTAPMRMHSHSHSSRRQQRQRRAKLPHAISRKSDRARSLPIYKCVANRSTLSNRNSHMSNVFFECRQLTWSDFFGRCSSWRRSAKWCWPPHSPRGTGHSINRMCRISRWRSDSVAPYGEFRHVAR